MSITTLISSTLRMTVPLLLAGLGVLVTSKSGIVNMGMEGNMLSAAFASVYVTYLTGTPQLGQLAGILTGMIYAACLGFFIIKCKGNHTVCGLGFNFIAQGFTTVLLGVVYNVSGTSPGITKLLQMDIPVIGKQSVNLLLAVVLCFAVWFMLQKTNFGLRIRSVGENPAAADSVGVDVAKYQLLALLISGALGGIAGSELALGQVGYFAKLMTASKGFLAYSAVVFGGFSVKGLTIATLFLGFLDAFQMRAQSLFNIPGQFFLMLPYLFTVIALVGVGNIRQPAATGKIYERGNF